MNLPDNYQVVNEKGIYGFFNEYRFLSNFHPCNILVEGIMYPSTEHAYMAYKTDNQSLKERIAAEPTPGKAHKLGQIVKLRSDWDHYKVAAMLNCLYLKFVPGTELADMLLATGDRYLEETNWWRDKFWGVYKPVEGNPWPFPLPKDESPGGLNMLGKCLMIVRDNLRGIK